MAGPVPRSSPASASRPPHWWRSCSGNATSTVSSGYPRVMLAMILMGAGMGLSVAPATESIMGSLPLHQAGVGSAVNDTSREVGGALGVAIVGSMLSSLYATNLNAKLPANVPTQVRDAANQSVGAALQVSAQLGRVGAPLAAAARESFVSAMSRASLVTAAVALVGALLAWRFLPARAAEAQELVIDVEPESTDAADSLDPSELVRV